MNRPSESTRKNESGFFRPDIGKLAALQKIFFPRGREKTRKLEFKEKDFNAVNAVELAALNTVVICSSADSHKFKRMFSHIIEASGQDLEKGHISGIIPIAEEPVEEEEYNHLPVINHSPRIIAAIKAYSGRRYQQADPEKRSDEVMSDIRKMHEKHDPESKNFSFNEIGCLVVFRAQDIVTSLVIGEKEKRQLKPKTQDKHQIYEKLCEIFETDNNNRPEELEMHWTGAEALHDAISDVGVVCETTARLKIKAPDRAFLYCQILGTENVPVEFQEMADRFNEIYRHVISDTEKNHGERLRGWNPKDGILKPHAVNAGFHSDTIFVEELLTQSVSNDELETDKNDPSFDTQMEKAISLVRGEPVSFNRTYNTLLHILAAQAAEIESGIDASQLLKGIGDKVQEEIGDKFPETPRIFGGSWYDISDDQEQVPEDKKGQADFIAKLVMMYSEGETIH